MSPVASAHRKGRRDAAGFPLSFDASKAIKDKGFHHRDPFPDDGPFNGLMPP